VSPGEWRFLFAIGVKGCNMIERYSFKSYILCVLIILGLLFFLRKRKYYFFIRQLVLGVWCFLFFLQTAQGFIFIIIFPL